MPLQSESSWTHVGIIASILVPLGSGIGYLIWQQAQMALKVNTVWAWFSNDAHEFTGYRPGDEFKKRK